MSATVQYCVKVNGSGYWPFLLVSSNTEAIHCFQFESKGQSGQLFVGTNQCVHHDRFSELQSATISAMEQWVCLQRYWGIIYWERVSPFGETVWKGIITLLLCVNEIVWKCFINFLQPLLFTKIPVSVVVGDFERPQMKYYCWWDLLFKLQDPNIQKVKKNTDFNRATWNGFKSLGQTPFFQAVDWRVNSDKWKMSSWIPTLYHYYLCICTLIKLHKQCCFGPGHVCILWRWSGHCQIWPCFVSFLNTAFAKYFELCSMQSPELYLLM